MSFKSLCWQNICKANHLGPITGCRMHLKHNLRTTVLRWIKVKETCNRRKNIYTWNRTLKDLITMTVQHAILYTITNSGHFTSRSTQTTNMKCSSDFAVYFKIYANMQTMERIEWKWWKICILQTIKWKIYISQLLV